MIDENAGTRDYTFPDDFDALVERVDRLEKEKDELEEGIVRMILILRQFLNNPKVKATFGGHWMSPETADEIERKLSGAVEREPVPGAPKTPEGA